MFSTYVKLKPHLTKDKHMINKDKYVNLGSVSRSTCSTFKVYDTDLPPPTEEFEGRRVVNFLYNKSEFSLGNEPRDSFIVIPDHITEENVIRKVKTLFPAIRNYLMQEEDQWLKDLHVGNCDEVISDSMFNLDNLVRLLESKADAHRLNSSELSLWFKLDVEKPLKSLISLSLKSVFAVDSTSAKTEETKITEAINYFSSLFIRLNKKTTVYTEQQLNSMLDILNNCRITKSASLKSVRSRIVYLQNLGSY